MTRALTKRLIPSLGRYLRIRPIEWILLTKELFNRTNYSIETALLRFYTDDFLILSPHYPSFPGTWSFPHDSSLEQWMVLALLNLSTVCDKYPGSPNSPCKTIHAFQLHRYSYKMAFLLPTWWISESNYSGCNILTSLFRVWCPPTLYSRATTICSL